MKGVWRLAYEIEGDTSNESGERNKRLRLFLSLAVFAILMNSNLFVGVVQGLSIITYLGRLLGLAVHLPQRAAPICHSNHSLLKFQQTDTYPTQNSHHGSFNRTHCIHLQC